MGLVHLHPSLSKNTWSLQISATQNDILDGIRDEKFKEDLMSCTWGTTILIGLGCILNTLAAMQGCSFLGLHDHSISPFFHIHISPLVSCWWVAVLELADGQSNPLFQTQCQIPNLQKCDPHIMKTLPLHHLPKLLSLQKSFQRLSE